jgi:hypothetical protein
LHAGRRTLALSLPFSGQGGRTSLHSGFHPERTEVPMYQLLARGFSRSLEWTLLAIVCGCTLWVTVLALGIPILAN